MGRFIDLTGKNFYEWKVIEYVEAGKWLCTCSCGNTRPVTGNNLRQGKSKCCGCKGIERFREMATKHGKKDHRLYSVWRGMRERCSNKNYKK